MYRKEIENKTYFITEKAKAIIEKQLGNDIRSLADDEFENQLYQMFEIIKEQKKELRISIDQDIQIWHSDDETGVCNIFDDYFSRVEELDGYFINSYEDHQYHYYGTIGDPIGLENSIDASIQKQQNKGKSNNQIVQELSQVQWYEPDEILENLVNEYMENYSFD